MSQTYHEQIDYKNTMKLRELQKELPAFADDFFRAMEIKKATNTRRNYAYDLSTFFYFLRTTNSYFRDKDLQTLRYPSWMIFSRWILRSISPS